MDDISDTLAPKSDQLDNIELVDGPRTFTVDRVDVKVGTDQPVSVYFKEFPRPWKPGVTMRRVLAFCWGKHSSKWPGKRVTLFRDPDIAYGPNKSGGTRISHLSHIAGPTSVPILLSQGRPGTYKVEPLPDVAPAAPAEPLDSRIAKALAAFKAIGTEQDQLEHRIGADVAEWTEADLAQLQAVYQQAKAEQVQP